MIKARRNRSATRSPDRSEIVYRYADGWTVRRATLGGDIVRFIKLLSLPCVLAREVVAHHDKRGHDKPVIDDAALGHYLALVDPHGQPQAVFEHSPPGRQPHPDAGVSHNAITHGGWPLRDPSTWPPPTPHDHQISPEHADPQRIDALQKRIDEFDRTRRYVSGYLERAA